MKVLLDTHAFLWWNLSPHRLTPQALAAVTAAGAQLFLSVAAAWEIEIKPLAHKLVLVRPVADYIAEQPRLNQLQVLPVTLDHVLDLGNLPPIHADPFDRIMVAQARVEGMTLISADGRIARYPVSVVW